MVPPQDLQEATVSRFVATLLDLLHVLYGRLDRNGVHIGGRICREDLRDSCATTLAWTIELGQERPLGGPTRARQVFMSGLEDSPRWCCDGDKCQLLGIRGTLDAIASRQERVESLDKRWVTTE